MSKHYHSVRNAGPGLTEQLLSWDPFAHTSTNWFDPEWMFGVKRGFDIVIGNPPYLSSKNIEEKIKPLYKKIYKSPVAHYDIYVIFIEKALDLLGTGGILSFITSNKYFSQKYGVEIRKILLQHDIRRLINFNFNVFQATVDTSILIVSNREYSGANKIHVLNLLKSDFSTDSQKEYLFNILREKSSFSNIPQKAFFDFYNQKFRLDVNKTDLEIRDVLKDNLLPLSNFCLIIYGAVLHNSKLGYKKDDFIYKENEAQYKRYTEGKYISRWGIDKILFLDYKPSVHREPRYPELFEAEKLIGKRIIGQEGMAFLYDRESVYVDNTIHIVVPYHKLPIGKYSQLRNLLTEKNIENSKRVSIKYVLALLNSKLYKWYFQKFFSFGLDIYPDHLKNLPVKIIDKENTLHFERVIDDIQSVLGKVSLSSERKKGLIAEREEEMNNLIYEVFQLNSAQRTYIEENV